MDTAAAASPARRDGGGRRAPLRRLLAPRIGGAPGSAERRAFKRFALVVPLGNFAGAIDVFLFLWYVLPLPTVDDAAHVKLVNAVAFAVSVVVTFGLAWLWSNAIAAPIADWLESGEPADEAMVRRVLRHPLRQLEVNALMWALAALGFGVINATFSVPLGVIVATGIALGGVTTCGTTYLLAERTLRPITTRALSACAPREPVLPGVAARVLLAFGITTAMPLVGLGALGVLVLSGTDVSGTRLALTALVLAGAALGSGILGMTVVAHSLAEPLQSVRAALARVERGDLAADVRVDDGSEVGVLQAGFNSMVAGLRERARLRDLFGRHVGENVARAALERGVRLGGEQREAAVLFIDLVRSTALAAERSPAEVVSLLNRFFAIVVEVVDAHGGWVNKFEGDGALCVFGAPDDVPDAPGCALAAARGLDARLRAELPELPAGIGVSAGSVVAGHVGADERLEYTVIGDAVNEAARLTQLAKRMPGRVLASHVTVSRAGDDERERWRADGHATLRGRAEPTALAVPAGPTS
jgi:adenylate cyclase